MHNLELNIAKPDLLINHKLITDSPQMVRRQSLSVVMLCKAPRDNCIVMALYK